MRCTREDYCNDAAGHPGECAHHPTDDDWILACPKAFTDAEIRAAEARQRAAGRRSPSPGWIIDLELEREGMDEPLTPPDHIVYQITIRERTISLEIPDRDLARQRAEGAVEYLEQYAAHLRRVFNLDAEKGEAVVDLSTSTVDTGLLTRTDLS